MEKREMLYEGKAKKVFVTDNQDIYWIQYKDDATAFNGVKKGQILDKGIVNNRMSALFFQELEKTGMRTHFVELLNDREMLVRRLKMVPLEVVVRNVVAGSLSKRVGVDEGYRLPQPIVELYYKDDALGDPLVNDSHALAMDWATEDQISKMKAMGLAVNDLVKEVASKAGIDLIDFKLEFGMFEGEIYLGDEISPDTCRFWDKETKEKLDKDRFRRDLGKVEEAYLEVYNRIKGAIENA